MFAKERRDAILSFLKENKSIEVSNLSEYFKVSSVIIRKDLKFLEEKGLLERTHGGAIEKRKLALFSTFEERKIIHKKEKYIIAQKAFHLIKENDIILMDVSTINLIIGHLLFDEPKKITVITQSLDLIIILSQIPEITIISLGGIFDNKNNAFLGKLPAENIKKFNPQKYFLGAGGINIAKGTISNYEEQEGNIKKCFLEAGKEIYLLAEYQKFKEDSFYNFASLRDINYVISDDKFNKKELEEFNNLFIKVI
ncbi:MAG: DeoR/GlpR transcriptional regulator [Fusobacteriaceae bacterium]|nr:DeoR/GlpR transcriptional regulator [Fusobacteriaceae bacterium]